MGSASRIEHLRALAAEGSGATDGERAAALRALEIHEAKQADEVVRVDLGRFLDLEAWDRDCWDCSSRWPTPAESVSQQRARDVFDDLEGIHEAEQHAGRLGTLVVWRANESEADRLAKWKNARVRVPDGSVQWARSSSGTVHDPEGGRWGVLYKRRDLRPAHE
jgi:hypothetical protein